MESDENEEFIVGEYYFFEPLYDLFEFVKERMKYAKESESED